MKISVEVNLTELFDDSGETIQEWIEQIIKEDIQRQLKKSDKYKAYIEKQVKKAVDGLT